LSAKTIAQENPKFGSPHGFLKNIGQVCKQSEFPPIFQIFVRTRMSIEDDAIQEAQSASLGGPGSKLLSGHQIRG
jgi:hypothetical protein